MNILVTGGAGFIGKNLIESFLKEKENKVICIDNFLLGSMENIAEYKNNANFVFYKVDASIYEELANVFVKENIDIVYHLAANSDIKLSATNPNIDRKNTMETTITVLECMRVYGVKKLFFASTSAVYGDVPNERLSEEKGRLIPISYYGSCKLASEAIISSYSYMNDLKVVVFRFPNVVGPNLTHGVIFDFVQRLKTDSSKLDVLGDGTQDKQYIYIDDLVEAIRFFTKNLSTGILLMNIGVESSTTVKEIAEITVKEMNLTRTKINYSKENIGWKGDVPRFRYDLTKVHSLGWKATHTSNEAVEKTVKKFLERKL